MDLIARLFTKKRYGNVCQQHSCVYFNLLFHINQNDYIVLLLMFIFHKMTNILIMQSYVPVGFETSEQVYIFVIVSVLALKILCIIRCCIQIVHAILVVPSEKVFC